jgi:ATP-dependent helicase HrpA
VNSAKSLEAWRRQAEAAQPRLLFLAREDLMRHEAAGITTENFPPSLELGPNRYALEYHFEPGSPRDGVTMNVPLALLNQIDEPTIDWLVPGMIRDKVAWTMKALPKRIRTALVPVPEHVTRFLEWARPGERTVKDMVMHYAQRVIGDRIDDVAWSKEEPPPHLLMNLRVVDEARRELAMGRDLAELRKRLGEAATLTLAKSKPGLEREGITAWDFGELPEQVSFRRGNQTMTGFPALADEETSVAIRLFDTRDRADESHRAGVRRLMGFELREQLRQLERGLPGFNQVAMRFQPIISADRLRADLVAAIVDRAFIGDDPVPRTPKAFEEQKKRAKARLPAVSEAALRHANAVFEASQVLVQALAQNASLTRVVADVKAARDRLVYPGFLSHTPWERLEHLPRYLRGYALRLQKFRANSERDQKHAHTLHTMWQNYEARAKADHEAGRHDAKLEEYRWLLEELRVSLFAQELRTPFPVSAKRLQKFWDENLK